MDHYVAVAAFAMVEKPALYNSHEAVAIYSVV
jgi:hypothetical protein